MSSRNDPYIPDEEYLEKLNPGITRPQDDFLNQPQQTVANDNTPLVDGPTAVTTVSQREVPVSNEEFTQQFTQSVVNATPDATPESKISNSAAAGMIALAALFDLIGLLPLIGNITSTVGVATVFGVWFLILGVPLISPRKVASWGISLVAEAIPALGSVLPGVTLGVALVIFLTRVEEKSGLKLLSRTGIANPTQIAQQLTEGATPAGKLVGRVIQNSSEQPVSQERQMVDNVRKAT